MTLGEKLKKIRTEKKITQSELCGDKITRNLLSEIECNKVSPSMNTLKFLAERLEVPISYILSDDETPFYHQKNELIAEIRKKYSSASYTRCVQLIHKIDGRDDELYYILANCHFELGRSAVLNGSLRSGYNELVLSLSYCNETVYDTRRIENLILMYSALAKNIQSPLLEFDKKCFEEMLEESLDFEFFRYLVGDTSYKFKTPTIITHLKAKELMKERRYSEAIHQLTDIENSRGQGKYNAHIIFNVYCDLENCYKQLGDFENAYRYATKRLSLIEAFKS